eukprot:1375186-Rhodomonas_salina.1
MKQHGLWVGIVHQEGGARGEETNQKYRASNKMEVPHHASLLRAPARQFVNHRISAVCGGVELAVGVGAVEA